MSVHGMSHRGNAIRRAGLGVAGFVRRVLIEPIARRHRRRATLQALSDLDDRMLADIGIRRSEIEQVALGRLPRRIDSVAAGLVVGPVARKPDFASEMKRAA